MVVELKQQITIDGHSDADLQLGVVADDLIDVVQPDKLVPRPGFTTHFVTVKRGGVFFCWVTSAGMDIYINQHICSTYQACSFTITGACWVLEPMCEWHSGAVCTNDDPRVHEVQRTNMDALASSFWSHHEDSCERKP